MYDNKKGGLGNVGMGIKVGFWRGNVMWHGLALRGIEDLSSCLLKMMAKGDHIKF